MMFTLKCPSNHFHYNRLLFILIVLGITIAPVIQSHAEPATMSSATTSQERRNIWDDSQDISIDNVLRIAKLADKDHFATVISFQSGFREEDTDEGKIRKPATFVYNGEVLVIDGTVKLIKNISLSSPPLGHAVGKYAYDGAASRAGWGGGPIYERLIDLIPNKDESNISRIVLAIGTSDSRNILDSMFIWPIPTEQIKNLGELWQYLLKTPFKKMDRNDALKLLESKNPWMDVLGLAWLKENGKFEITDYFLAMMNVPPEQSPMIFTDMLSCLRTGLHKPGRKTSEGFSKYLKEADPKQQAAVFKKISYYISESENGDHFDLKRVLGGQGSDTIQTLQALIAERTKDEKWREVVSKYRELLDYLTK